MKYHRFEDLPVWQTSIELADKAFELCEDRSFNYQADIRSQLTRAALSISNNIAEGFERRTTNDLTKFLYTARASAGEIRSMLHVIARRERYQHLESKRAELLELANSVGRQLNAWIASLKQSRSKRLAHRPLTIDH